MSKNTIQELAEAVRDATVKADEANRTRAAYQKRLSEAREAFDAAQEELYRAAEALTAAAGKLPPKP